MIDSNESIKDTVTFSNYYGSNYKDAMDRIEKSLTATDGKTYVFIIFGVESFIRGFDNDTSRKLKTLFTSSRNNKNVRIIFADSITKIKMFEYEDFYRNCVQPINAVWIGSGITDQFTIKSSTYNKQTRSQIPIDFGYNIDRGNARFIKVLDFYTKD